MSLTITPVPYLELEGCDLYYEVNGSGPALFFAHGLGGNHMSWFQQVPHFRDRYTCVTFAHRGFAPSLQRAQGAPAASFVDDLERLIAHLGFAEVRLVAQSMGGWTCLGYTLANPGRVRALVMASTTGSLALGPEAAPHLAAAAAASRRLFEQGIHPAAGQRMAREHPALHFLYRELDILSAGLDKSALRDDLARLRIHSMDAVAALPSPILWLVAEEDVVMPPALFEGFESRFPASRVVGIPESGHSAYFERPAAFNAAVDTFLDSI